MGDIYRLKGFALRERWNATCWDDAVLKKDVIKADSNSQHYAKRLTQLGQVSLRTHHPESREGNRIQQTASRIQFATCGSRQQA